MRLLTTSILIILLFASCNKEDSTQEQVAPPSPFEELIGNWQLESHFVDGVEISDSRYEFMVIEEDENTSDKMTTGYFQEMQDSEKIPLTYAFSDIENQIIIQADFITFFCLYTLTEDNKLILDDQLEEITDIATWTRL